MKIKLDKLMQLLEVDEEDAMRAILALVSPPPPPATRQNWTRLSTFGNSAPSTKEFWKKLEEADFRCSKCNSQMRLSFNHINGNSKDHHLENLEVICYACNRAASKKGTKDTNQHLKIALATIELWQAKNKFPSLTEILKKAKVKQIGGATYLIKYLKNRLEKKKINSE